MEKISKYIFRIDINAISNKGYNEPTIQEMVIHSYRTIGQVKQEQANSSIWYSYDWKTEEGGYVQALVQRLRELAVQVCEERFSKGK